MNKLKLIVVGIVATLALVFATVPVAQAQYNLDRGISDSKGDRVAEKVDDPQQLVKGIVNGILYFVGILSVIMLIWGGILYTTSSGDSNKVTTAKNTIMYAVIGLVVAIFAYAIVNFVLTTSRGVSS
jgi:ABC-type Fe3+ transport system permease subunit